MQYTEEQLQSMPLNILRGLDIRDRDEEVLVQKILNTRLSTMPVGSPLVFPASVTDNLTVETERELQVKIDARNANLKAGLLVGIEEEEETSPLEEEDIPSPAPTDAPDEEIPVMPEMDEEVVPETPETVPETPVEPQPEVVGEIKFCDFCDSLGGRHKKSCTRPNKMTE